MLPTKTTPPQAEPDPERERLVAEWLAHPVTRHFAAAVQQQLEEQTVHLTNNVYAEPDVLRVCAAAIKHQRSLLTCLTKSPPMPRPRQ